MRKLILETIIREDALFHKHNPKLLEKALTVTSRKKLPDSAFAYIDDEGERHYPIYDKKHVQAAIAYAKKYQDDTAVAAWPKIVKAAKKFGIDAGELSESFSRKTTTLVESYDWSKATKAEQEFAAKLGIGPLYQPKETKKYICSECGKADAYYKEIHPDTSMNEIILYCPHCRKEVQEGKDNPGVPDGTGPYQGSAQKMLFGKGRKQQAGIPCPKTKKKKAKE